MASPQLAIHVDTRSCHPYKSGTALFLREGDRGLDEEMVRGSIYFEMEISHLLKLPLTGQQRTGLEKGHSRPNYQVRNRPFHRGVYP